MKKYLSLLALVPAISLAQPPNLIGTWAGEGVASVMGSGGHYPGNADAGVSFRSIKVAYIIEKQEGRSFSGVIKTPSHTEPFVGALRSDFRGGVIADTDGRVSFDLVGKDGMDICYSHPKSASGHAVAGCGQLKKQ